MDTFPGLLISGNFQDLEDLRKMQGLAHIHHINRAEQVRVIPEFVQHQRQVFGGIQRGAV